MKASFIISIKKNIPALLATTVLCIFLYLFTRHSGIGISPDSVTYYTVAVNICHHFSFTDFNNTPLVDFPVGYPGFLGIIMWLSGFTPLQAAPFINMALVTGVIFFTGTILRQSSNSSSVYSFVLMSVLACSPALLEVYSMLWSETLFIFLSLLFIIVTYRYLRSHTLTSLLAMGLVAALAFFTRYAGISLVLTGLFLLFFDGGLPIKKKIQHLLIFGFSSCSLTAINLIYNHHTTASLTGVRERALRTIAENISQISDTIAGWLPFPEGYQTLAVIIFLLVFIAAALLLLYHILQQQYFPSYETIVAAFFIVYILFLTAIASVSRFEDISSRLLSPAYIPFLLLTGNGIIVFTKKLTTLKKRLFLCLALLFFAGLQYHQYQLNAAAWEGIKDAGIPGYTEDSWKTSATIQYLKQNEGRLSGYPLYSDAYDGVFFLSGLHTIPLPHKEIMEEINDLLHQPSFYVIWLNDGFNTDLVDINFIRQHKKLISVKQFTDGAIYFFSTDSFPQHL